MTGLVLGLALAVLASVALNGSYLLQHAGSRGAPAVDARRPLATARGLLASRWWLVGAAAGLSGWAIHVAALSKAPLSLVQAFAAGGLALTVPVAARAFGQRLSRADHIAVGALVGALALLGLGAAPAATTVVPVVPLALTLAAAAAVALVLALAPADGRRAHRLGAAGGVLYGAADAATKAVTLDAHGAVGLLTTPWTLLVVLASAGAFLCFQRGLQIGPAVPVIALMTAATAGVSILSGLLAFGDPLAATPMFAALHLVAFATAVVAGWRLAAAQGGLVPAEVG
jgi:hypothetical protein